MRGRSSLNSDSGCPLWLHIRRDVSPVVAERLLRSQDVLRERHTCAGGTVFFRIGRNRSRFFMRLRRESTHALSSVFPCLMPMPYGCGRNRSPSSACSCGSVTAMPSRALSSNMSVSARPSRNAINAFEKTVRDDELRILEAVLDPACRRRSRSSWRPSFPRGRRVSGSRSCCARAAPGRLVVGTREVDPRLTVGVVGERCDHHVHAPRRQRRLTGRL